MENLVDWDRIVEDIGPRLFRYFCVRFTKEQSDDLTQETLIRLVRKVEENKFNPDKGSLRMLSFGIAHYVGLEAKQFDRNDSVEEEWAEELISDIDMEQIIITKESVRRVREYMKMLSSIEQQVLSLFIEDELTLSEIGTIVQAPVGTIKSHIFRAKKKLMALTQKERLL